MAYVTVPKDLTHVKSKVVFGLTKRQLICFSGALVIGVPLYFLTRDYLTNSAAALLMVFAMLPEALRLIKAWGFSFKTVAFVWLKQNRKSLTWFYGLGRWTRGNAEICLLATHGKPKRRSASVHQFIISPIEQHSKKPDVTREKIVELAGDLPRVELFARQKTPGWDVWGNEVECDLILT